MIAVVVNLARAVHHHLPAPVLVALGCAALLAFGAYDYLRNSP